MKQFVAADRESLYEMWSIPKSWWPMPWLQCCKHNPFQIEVGCVQNLAMCISNVCLCIVQTYVCASLENFTSCVCVILACILVLARPRLHLGAGHDATMRSCTFFTCGLAYTSILAFCVSVCVLHIRRRRESRYSKCAAAAFGCFPDGRIKNQ